MPSHSNPLSSDTLEWAEEKLRRHYGPNWRDRFGGAGTYVAPSERCWLDWMKNPYRHARQTLAAKTVKDLICLFFDTHLTPGFNLDESTQFADASPNSALALLHRR